MRMPRLILELAAIFLLVPVAIWRHWLAVPLIFIPLYLLTAYAVLWLLKRGGYGRRQFWLGDDPAAEKAALKMIAWRFVAVVAAVGLVVYGLYPQKLFVLPREHPLVWLLILALYPLFSVYPQEILYRAFFFTRYAALFAEREFMVIASTLCFMLMHMVFGNGIALLSTLIGGYLFADTYSRTRSLRLVCLEHTLYGYVIFTVGLGEFFVFGGMKSFLA